MPLWRPKLNTRDGRESGQEVLERRGFGPTIEFDHAFRAAIGADINAVVADLTAEFDRVIATQIRDVIHELIDDRRPLQRRPPRASTQIRKALNVDLRQGTYNRIRHAGVDSVR